MEGQPWVDEVIVFPRAELRRGLLGARPVLLARHLRGFLRTLRSRRFELVLDFHAILRSGVLSLLSGAPLRVTYAPPTGGSCRGCCPSFGTSTGRTIRSQTW